MDRAFFYLQNSCADITVLPILNVDNLNSNEMIFIVNQEEFFSTVKNFNYLVSAGNSLVRKNTDYPYVDSGLPILICIDKVWYYVYGSKVDAVEIEKRENADARIQLGIPETTKIKFAHNMQKNPFLNQNQLVFQIDNYIRLY